jgi:hypothetical protein
MPRKKKVEITQPYGYNENIFVAYEFPFGRDVMKPGDIIKIKNQRGKYRFIKVAHHAGKDVTWVDVMNVDDGQYYSFYVERIKLIIRPKKSRRKKQSVV